MKQKEWISYVLLTAIVGFIFISIISVLFLEIIDFDDINNSNYGMLGGYIGGIAGPILSFITIIYLITSINIQRATLENTTEELKLTRKELVSSTEALAIQAKQAELSNEQLARHNSLSDSVFIFEKLEDTLNQLVSRTVYFKHEGEHYLATFDGKEAHGGSDPQHCKLNGLRNSCKAMESRGDLKEFRVKISPSADQKFNEVFEVMFQMHMCIQTFLAKKDFAKFLFYSEIFSRRAQSLIYKYDFGPLQELLAWNENLQEDVNECLQDSGIGQVNDQILRLALNHISKIARD